MCVFLARLSRLSVRIDCSYTRLSLRENRLLIVPQLQLFCRALWITDGLCFYQTKSFSFLQGQSRKQHKHPRNKEIGLHECEVAKKYENEIIWNNRFIRIDGKSVFYPSWYRKGIIKIGHLLNDNRQFLSRSEFQHKYGLTVNFLTYNGLLATIPEVWKRSILNSERILTDVDRHDLSPANVNAKSARELLVLKVFKAPNVEIKLVEKHLLIKAIYELPFKVTIENKLRCF